MLIDIDSTWKYKLTNKELLFDNNIQNEIKNNWQKFIKDKTSYWDGEIFVVSNINIDNKILEISKTKFSSLVYAKETGNIKIYSLFSSILFKTLDNKYLVIKNNHDKLNIIGGMADINDFIDNYYSPYLCIKREIKEEIGLDIDNDKQIIEYKPSYLRIPNNDNYCPTGIVFTGVLNFSSKDFVNYMNNNSFDEEIKKCYFYSLEDCLNLDLSDKDISYLKEILTNKEKKV